MLEIIVAALTAAATVGLPMLGWVLRLQGRLVALETWREISEGYWTKLEQRIFDALERIESKLDGKADRYERHARNESPREHG